MMVTEHNIERLSLLLPFALAQRSRLSLERYTIWPGSLHRETTTFCQIAPAIRRPAVSCTLFTEVGDGRLWLRLNTVVGTLLVPATTREEVKASRCSQVTLGPERVIVSCFGASGCFRRWTFESNELAVANFKTNPELPIVTLLTR